MNGLDQYLVPYIISQVASFIILIVAWKRSRWARWLFALLFFWASLTNMYFGITNPNIYQEYDNMAAPLYREFINGWFSRNNYIVIPLIAIGQFFIAIAMLLNGIWVRLACIGSIIFLLSIAPLLVGSAFPFSITVSIAAFLIYRNDDKNFAWKRQLKLAF
jgi:hypothetical protein